MRLDHAFHHGISQHLTRHLAPELIQVHFHAIHDPAMIQRRAPGLGLLRRQEQLPPLSLLIGEFISAHTSQYTCAETV
jgi:hypothetical protein